LSSSLLSIIINSLFYIIKLINIYFYIILYKQQLLLLSTIHLL